MPQELAGSRVASLGQFVRRAGRADRIALLVLVGFPTALWVPFSLAGHPLLTNDNITQNYPLRVLAGEIIRSGRLPAWDPLIWSGTPLLAGWNAGAMYPGTFLFAVLPTIAAWTINLVSVAIICGLGTYVLLRLLRCGPLGSAVGAMCFTYTGFMSGQIGHIGLVQGTGYTPWVLVGIELVARSDTRRAALWSSLLVAVSIGLLILAGEPRAVSSGAVIVVLYLAVAVVRVGRRRRLRLSRGVLGGIALGAGIAAIQWVPGLSFVSSSQRGLNAFTSFGAGSLPWLSIAHLVLVPFLLGAYGNFGMESFRGSYNLPEVTVGVGILPLVAVGAYLPELVRRAWAATVRRATHAASRVGRADDKDLGVWYLIGFVGLALTLSTTTPLGHLLIKIPLFSGQRLQNRNAVIFDFALAVLGGFFVDDLGRRRSLRSDEASANPLRTVVGAVLCGAAAPAACVALVVIAFLFPLGLQHRFGDAYPSRQLFQSLAPYLIGTAAVAGAFGLFVLVAHRLSRKTRLWAVAAVAALDIGTFLAMTTYQSEPSQVLASATKQSVKLTRYIGPDGRFAIYNPLVLSSPAHPDAFTEIGETDLNILRDRASVQGYGSIVGGAYQTATSTHDFEDLAPSTLSDGLASTLDLRALLTLPQYLVDPLPPHSGIPVAGGPAAPSDGSAGVSTDAPAPPVIASGPWTVPAGGNDRWMLTKVSNVVRVTVVIDASPTPVPRTLEVGLELPGKSPTFTTLAVTNNQAHFSSLTPVHAQAVVIRNPTGTALTIGAVVATTSSPDERLLLDGALQGALRSTNWSYAGTIGPFTVFTNSAAAGLAWLQPAGATDADPTDLAPGSVVTTTEVSSTAEQMRVTTTEPTLLVRSETFQSGWTARLTPAGGGRTTVVPVQHLGLVQAVKVPAGQYVITWRYAPRSILVGLVVSGGSLVVLVLLAAVELLRRRHRRPTRAAAHEGA